MDGSGYGHGPHDYFPPSWHLTVTKLDDNFNLLSEEQRFAQKGFNPSHNGLEVSIHGKMKSKTTWEMVEVPNNFL